MAQCCKAGVDPLMKQFTPALVPCRGPLPSSVVAKNHKQPTCPQMGGQEVQRHVPVVGLQGPTNHSTAHLSVIRGAGLHPRYL
jgi:hypothetical protein